MANFWGKTRPFYWKTHPDNLGCFGPKNSKRWVFQKYSQAHPKIEISKRNWMCFPEKRFSITCGQWVQGVFFTFENVLGPEKDRITGNLIISHDFWGVTSDVLLKTRPVNFLNEFPIIFLIAGSAANSMQKALFYW